MRFKQREKVSYILLLLVVIQDAIILAFDNKIFLLPCEYEKSSKKAVMFLLSSFATKGSLTNQF